MTADMLMAAATSQHAKIKTKIESGERQLGVLFSVHRDKTGWSQMPMPPQVNEGMNSGTFNDALFRIMRLFVANDPTIDATLFGAEMWMAKATPKMQALDMKKIQEALMDTGFETLIKNGLMMRSEVYNIVVQNRSHVVTVAQEFRRTNSGLIQWLGEPIKSTGSQEDYEGRTKMFGDLSPSKLHEHATSKQGERA